MSLFGFRRDYGDDDLAVAPGHKDGKLYKTVQLIAISVIAVAIILLVLEVFQIIKVGSTVNGVIFSIAVIGLGGLSALPWVRVLEGVKDKPFKITSIVFLALIGVCVILWIVCVWKIIGIYQDLKADMTDEALEGALSSLNVIRASIIVTIQFVIASGITMNFVKYRKTLLPYQIMYGAAMAYIDFFFILLLTAFTVTTDGIEFTTSANFFLDHWQWLLALFVIAAALSALPMVVFRRADRKRLLSSKKEEVKGTTDADFEPKQAPSSDETVEQKLKKIKDLLNGGLITQEEYDAKRAEILKDL